MAEEHHNAQSFLGIVLNAAKRHSTAVIFFALMGGLLSYFSMPAVAVGHAPPTLLASAYNVGILVTSGAVVLFACLMVRARIRSSYQRQRKRPISLDDRAVVAIPTKLGGSALAQPEETGEVRSRVQKQGGSHE